MATVNTIKRYLAITLFGDISRYNDLDIFCNNELMGRDYSMKFIEKTRCRNKPKDTPINSTLANTEVSDTPIVSALLHSWAVCLTKN
uniref:Transposase n=1 Tax=Loa loa TaxID=7209 RepID=A0A1I7VEV1_LOALO